MARGFMPKGGWVQYGILLVVIGLGVAYYKKWPPLMKFLHAPKVAPKPVVQPMPPAQPQQGVHPLGATPGAIQPQGQAMIMPQQQFGYGFGGIPQLGLPQMMPQTMPLQPPYQPMMMPQVGVMGSPTLMSGIPYGQVV